jgi:sugar fermentation stimulation protein A
VADGYDCYVLFVIQMADVEYLHPNDSTDPDFGKALREAAAAGVQILAMDCDITENSMEIREKVEVRL